MSRFLRAFATLAVLTAAAAAPADAPQSVDGYTITAKSQVRIGENHRSQLAFGDGAVIVGDVRGERRPPRSGEVTHSVMVRVLDATAHCARI